VFVGFFLLLCNIWHVIRQNFGKKIVKEVAIQKLKNCQKTIKKNRIINQEQKKRNMLNNVSN